MAGHRNWSELRNELRSRRPGFEEGVAKASHLLQSEIADHERTMVLVRKARALTQAAVRDELKVSETRVGQIESEVVIYLSTLARNLELVGAPLELAAVLEDQHVQLTVDDLAGPGAAAPKSQAELVIKG